MKQLARIGPELAEIWQFSLGYPEFPTYADHLVDNESGGSPELKMEKTEAQSTALLTEMRFRTHFVRIWAVLSTRGLLVGDPGSGQGP